jgi:hypothetical protein
VRIKILDRLLLDYSSSKKKFNLIFFSYSIVTSDKNDTEASLQIMSLINELIITEKDIKNLIILFTALGNLLYNSEGNRAIANDMDIPSTLKSLNIAGGDEDSIILSEIYLYLISILK